MHFVLFFFLRSSSLLKFHDLQIEQTLDLPLLSLPFNKIKINTTPHRYIKQTVKTEGKFNITKSTANSKEEIKENY